MKQHKIVHVIKTVTMPIQRITKNLFKNEYRDLPGGPVVKTSPSSAGGVGLVPGQRAKIPHASQPKQQNMKQKKYCDKFSKNLKINITE